MLAQGNWSPWTWVLIALLALMLVLVLVLFKFINLWIQAKMTKTEISLLQLIMAFGSDD